MATRDYNFITGVTSATEPTVSTPTVSTDLTTKDYVDTKVSTDISTHNSDTTSVHGIADTSVLVTLDGTQTLTNKTLTSPVINTPTGITKSDVGLGNVDNTSDATKWAATKTLTNTTFDADGTGNSISNIENADIKAGANIAYNKMAALTQSRVMVTDTSGVATASSVTSTTLGYLDATSSVQTQLDNKVSGADFVNHTSDTTGVHGIADTSILVTTTGAQTLTNKDIDGGTASNSNRITLPKGVKTNLDGLTRKEGTVVYATDSQRAFLDNGSTLVEIGSGGGGGSGGINYITNPDAEVDASDWFVSKNTTAAAIPDLGFVTSGVNITWTRTTTNPLRDLGSFVLTKDAANRQGEQAYTNFTIAAADKARLMQISFDVETSTNYVDDDLIIYILDVDNSRFIEPVNFKIKKAGLIQKHIATFQTSSDADEYTLFFHVAGTNALSWTVKVDNVQVGPQLTAIGAFISDWTDQGTITLTATTTNPTKGTTGTDKIYLRRVGDTLEGRIEFHQNGAGTAGSGDYLINLPSGYSIDTNKVKAYATVEGNSSYLPGVGGAVGWGSIGNASSGGTNGEGPIIVYDATRLRFFHTGVNSAGSTHLSCWGSAFLPLSGTTISFSATFSVPIVGWGSNVSFSSADSGRIVAGSAYRASSSQTGVNPNNSAVKVQLNSTTASGGHGYDTHAGWDTATNYRYTVRESGYYKIAASVDVAGTNVLAARYYAYVYRNGSGALLGSVVNASAGVAFIAAANGVLYLNAGDYLELFLFGSGNNSASTLTIPVSSISTFMDVVKVTNGNQAVSAGEFVGAKYQTDAGQSINNNTSTIIDFEDKIFDTHNAVTTGASWKFSAPMAGYYLIECWNQSANGGGWAAGEYWQTTVHKNANATTRQVYYQQATHTARINGTIVDIVQLNQGEYVDIRVIQTSGAALALNANATDNSISIIKVG